MLTLVGEIRRHRNNRCFVVVVVVVVVNDLVVLITRLMYHRFTFHIFRSGFYHFLINL